MGMALERNHRYCPSKRLKRASTSPDLPDAVRKLPVFDQLLDVVRVNCVLPSLPIRLIGREARIRVPLFIEKQDGPVWQTVPRQRGDRIDASSKFLFRSPCLVLGIQSRPLLLAPSISTIHCMPRIKQWEARGYLRLKRGASPSSFTVPHCCPAKVWRGRYKHL